MMHDVLSLVTMLMFHCFAVLLVMIVIVIFDSYNTVYFNYIAISRYYRILANIPFYAAISWGAYVRFGSIFMF